MRIFLVAAALLLFAAPARAELVDQIAAIVNGEALTCSEVEQAADDLGEQLRQGGATTLPARQLLLERALDGRIVQMLQTQEAKQLGVGVDDEEIRRAMAEVESNNGLAPGSLREALKAQGIDFATYRQQLADNILNGKLINIAVRSRISLSEEALREYYRKNLKDPKPVREIRLAQLFLALSPEPTPEEVATQREKAAQLRAQAAGGESFGQLVAMHSDAPDAASGGEIGWVAEGAIAPQFANIFQLPVGSVSEPIRSTAGFHLFMVQEERINDPAKEAQSYDEVHARHILLQIPGDADAATADKIRARAAAIAQEMKKANDAAFASRAKEISQAPDSERGGDLGWFKRGLMVPAFEEAVFALQAGETSGVVETRFGLHVIRLVERRHVDPNSFEAHRSEIENQLMSAELQDRLPRFIAGLKGKARIDRRSCPVTAPTAAATPAPVAMAPSLPAAAAPVVAPAPESAAEAAATIDDALAGVGAAVEGWRRAWSSRDTRTFFSFYRSDRSPDVRYADFAAWQRYKQRAITSKSSIEVSLSEIAIEPLDSGRMRATFRQRYRSDRLQSDDDKELIWQRGNDGRWQIVSERTR